MNETVERTSATRRDLHDQNVDKVFQDGFAADQTEEAEEQAATALVQAATLPPAARPAFGVNAIEMDAAKMMAMSGPLIPLWLRGNPGSCWAMIQLSKRWTKFDPRTNSWIHFDPITIAQSTYLVTSQGGGESIGFMSVFIRALIDAFAPLQGRLRYEWIGEGENLRCRVIGLLRGERDPHVYETPALREITPKKSPLWQSDPKRQLAYYGSRAWGRLYCSGILHGVYDPEELEGEVHQGPARAKDVTSEADGLAERLAKHRDTNGTPTEGFNKAIEATPEVPGSQKRPTEPVQAKTEAKGHKGKAKRRKRTHAARSAGAEPIETEKPSNPPNASASMPGAEADPRSEMSERKAEAAPQQDPKPEPKRQPPAAPRNPTQYKAHVAAWLAEYTTEQAIEERWRMEMNLRNAAFVTSDIRAEIRIMIDQRIAELRHAASD